LATKVDDPKYQENRLAELNTLSVRIQTREQELSKTVPIVDRVAKLSESTPGDLRKVLPDDAVFIDYISYVRHEIDRNKPGQQGEKWTSCFAAFVISKQAIEWVDLGPSYKIKKAVATWREAITTPPHYIVAADIPSTVRDLVWQPLKGFLPKNVKTVYISPDAELTGLPWVAIPSDDNKVLLNDYQLAVVSHGPFLLDQLWPPTKKTEPNKPIHGFLAVGNVAYDEVIDQVGRNPQQSNGIFALSPGLAKWHKLPGSQREIEKVIALASQRGNTALMTIQAKEASVARILHELPKTRSTLLSTHGAFAEASFRSQLQVDPKYFERDGSGRHRISVGANNPSVLSALVFAGANLSELPGRGFLTAESVLDTDLSALELAFLSACETGLGDVAGGEGVFGLQRSFHLAGCRDVIASQWRVGDEATAALVVEFYRNLWNPEKPLPPIEALRQAQLTMMKVDPKDFFAMTNRAPGKGDVKDLSIPVAGKPMPGNKINPPAFWAAFTLSGLGK
jgi:CHAT domain-containing protein